MLSNKPRLHAQLQKHNKSYWKVKTVIWLFSRGWGLLNSFSARWGGNLNKNFPKVQMPGGLPGGDVEPSIWLVHNVALAQWRENPLGSTEFCGIRDQNSHHFWNQGSRIWVKYGISEEKIYLVTTLIIATDLLNFVYVHCHWLNHHPSTYPTLQLSLI